MGPSLCGWPFFPGSGQPDLMRFLEDFGNQPAGEDMNDGPVFSCAPEVNKAVEQPFPKYSLMFCLHMPSAIGAKGSAGFGLNPTRAGNPHNAGKGIRGKESPPCPGTSASHVEPLSPGNTVCHAPPPVGLREGCL